MKTFAGDLRGWCLVTSILFLGLQSSPAQAGRVLLLTQSSGFEHDVVKRPSPGELSIVEQRLTAALAGQHEVVTSRNAADINAANLATFDTVVFYTTGELPIDASGKTALLNFVNSGKGFVGIHSATDTLHTWPEYGQLIGARFNGHPWTEPVVVKLNVTDHPSTAHLPVNWSINEEIYQFKEFMSTGTQVLLSLDLTSVDKSLGADPDGPYPLAWTRQFGAGRVFYTALGHGPDIWADNAFLQHVVGGIQSVTAGATPVPLPASVWAGGIMLVLVVGVMYWRKYVQAARDPIE